jgi:uncharacterized protein YqcC (DUF446 family)
MKLEEEVQTRLNNLELELKQASEWYNKSRTTYHRDKKDWGSADPGEMYAASNCVDTLTASINTLKWVLSSDD